MGWKLSAIIIKTDKRYEDKEILGKLWNDPLPEKVDDVTFDNAMYPKDYHVHLGYYKNCFILTTYVDELVEKCLVKEIPIIEQIFISLFPGSTIGAFQLHSSCNYFAYSILENGVKRRVKSSADGEISTDYGLPLKEEEEFFSYRFIDKNKEIMYKMPTKNGEFEIYEENQIGEEFVSRIWSKFTGIELFEDDVLLNETIFRSYKFEIEDENSNKKVKRSFWKRLFGRKASSAENTLANENGIKPTAKYLGLQENLTQCSFCKESKPCFDTSFFLYTEEVKSICKDCLMNGKLMGLDGTTCSGDIVELKKQLKKLNPNYSEKEIDRIADQKTKELEKTTPQLITWQDWDWPCADGDYCKFIGYGSKALYNELSKNNGKTLFLNSLYKHLKGSDTEYLWDEIMIEDEIKNYEDSSRYATLFYVFKSLNSENIVTIWDCA